jgi:hypothetical protein
MAVIAAADDAQVPTSFDAALVGGGGDDGTSRRERDDREDKDQP